MFFSQTFQALELANRLRHPGFSLIAKFRGYSFSVLTLLILVGDDTGGLRNAR